MPSPEPESAIMISHGSVITAFSLTDRIVDGSESSSFSVGIITLRFIGKSSLANGSRHVAKNRPKNIDRMPRGEESLLTMTEMRRAFEIISRDSPELEYRAVAFQNLFH